MISVIMPYWKRQEALSQNLEQYRNLYPHDDLEIIVVDDGSPVGAVVASEFPWPVSVIRLPSKGNALNPCVPFNVGVRRSRGDKIVLTNPEVVHRTAILGHMAEKLDETGPKGYVAAACWNDATKLWYCHSRLSPPPRTMGRAKMPDGSAFHFCAMLYRSFYDEIGGFSEEYRNGQGYEDNDLLWKLHDACARFVILDDCVTDHIQCARCDWHGGTNQVLFERRWPQRA